MQSSPFVNYTAMGLKDQGHPAILRHYGGSGHPVNATFDYSFVKHAGAGDSLMPNVDPSNRGYIVTGFTQADGLSRCMIVELPLRPLASLAELTHWDARFENCVPPYAMNIVANSDASPLLPPDKVVNSRDADLQVNLQYDDSYCANHLLFDDWFLSSITPVPGNFGATARSQKQTYSDFLTGASPLANRAYRPIREDAAASDTDSLFAKHIAPADAWKTIASRIEVDGMFNVNSTSVTAWRALLGQPRGRRGRWRPFKYGIPPALPCRLLAGLGGIHPQFRPGRYPALVKSSGRRFARGHGRRQFVGHRSRSRRSDQV
jgi:hypothetical protein